MATTAVCDDLSTTFCTPAVAHQAAFSQPSTTSLTSLPALCLHGVPLLPLLLPALLHPLSPGIRGRVVSRLKTRLHARFPEMRIFEYRNA